MRSAKISLLSPYAFCTAFFTLGLYGFASRLLLNGVRGGFKKYTARRRKKRRTESTENPKFSHQVASRQSCAQVDNIRGAWGQGKTCDRAHTHRTDYHIHGFVGRLAKHVNNEYFSHDLKRLL